MNKKCFQDIVGFDDKWIIIVGLPVASVLISLLLFNEYYVKGDLPFLMVCIPMSFVYTGAFWYALRWAYTNIRLKYPHAHQLGRRLVLMLLVFIVINFIVNGILKAIFSYFIPEHQTHPNKIVVFISALLTSSFIIMLYEALSFYLQLQRATAEKADLERKNVESQLEGLRNQVNPHFLFNSLNTLIYLIPEDPNKAVRFVQQLSKVYRYVLESRETRVIPLSEELDYLQSYVYLLKERFGENLVVQTSDLQAIKGMAIVPLSLQMLFENAIKHNVISTEKPLTIEVFAEHTEPKIPSNGVKTDARGCPTLIIRNNLQRKNQIMDSTGVGLENIRARYQMLTERNVETIVSHQYFTVALPLIELNHL
ncbi:MAG: sensor histidine kinase [Saprospiraceae bacterium]|jgi:sensor histidine kinase YesM